MSSWAPGSFLDRLEPELQGKLLALGVTRVISSGRRIFTEGGQDTHVEIIQRGVAKVTMSVGGTEQLLAVRLPGDLVGEFAALTDGQRIATVTACGEVRATVVQQSVFRAFLSRHLEVASEVTATVGRRLHWANLRRADFSAFPVPVRLARVLLELVEVIGEPVEGGVRIAVDLTHAELATLIGAVDDTVQRTLRGMRDDGVIRTGYRRITVTDPDQLSRRAEEAL
ncbi:Crp/Fnr family transcriptional regulator [Micromonospora tulbaghiae]|uniref:Crp/Fnr family transcriptional regulator n=1 Tax=Micromonospora tulbaghiae TaxID=479978 RepID=UPI0034254D5C